MQLLNLTTGKTVELGDKVRVATGHLVGHNITAWGICAPNNTYPHGIIVDNTNGRRVALTPRVLDCIFIEDDSVVMSVTYGNESSLKTTIDEILHKLRADGRQVRKILMGSREWDRSQDLDERNPPAPSTGKIPPPKFLGVLIERLPHREKCLAFEHGPIQEKTDG